PSELAERYLGGEQYWRELYDLNRGRLQADGQAWTIPDQIRSGWILELPPDDDQTELATATRVHVVAPDETLSGIAEADLGDAHPYPHLAEATAPLEQPDGRHLTDPDLILPGWTIIEPDLSAPESDGGSRADNTATTAPAVDSAGRDSRPDADATAGLKEA